MATGVRAALLASFIHTKRDVSNNNIVPIDEVKIEKVSDGINVVVKMSNVMEGIPYILNASDQRTEVLKMYDNICSAISYMHSLGIMVPDITFDQIFFHDPSNMYCLGNFANCYFSDIFPLIEEHEESDYVKGSLLAPTMTDDFAALKVLMEKYPEVSNESSIIT